MMMSVIQVFYHDKMAAVAHMIGSDQIPKPEQVTFSRLAILFLARLHEVHRAIVVTSVVRVYVYVYFRLKFLEVYIS